MKLWQSKLEKAIEGMGNFSYPIPSFDLTNNFLSFTFFISYRLSWGRMILNFLLFYTWLFKIDREVQVGVCVTDLFSWYLVK